MGTQANTLLDKYKPFVHGGHMTVREQIEKKLKAQFAPTSLEVIDESHLHAGHVVARPEGETHFRVRLVSDHFAGQNRVARQRSIYRCLAEELAGPVHALALTALTPEEADKA